MQKKIISLCVLILSALLLIACGGGSGGSGTSSGGGGSPPTPAPPQPPPIGDLCAGVFCASGETCDPGTGQCIADDLCAGVTCSPGQICNPATGGCEGEIIEPPEGWPAEVPAPWEGWDEMPAASAVMVNTDGDDMTISCTGTPGNLAGLTADTIINGTANGVISITANYCVIHDIVFEGYVVRVSGDHYVIRDCEINGAGRTQKNGLSLSGTNGVAYRNYSHHLMGNDRHCFSNGGGAMNMWFIENEGYACSGDGYQAGHQSENNRPTNIYLVQNIFHGNRENGLDYKFLENVYAVENVLYGFVSTDEGTWCFPDDPTTCSSSNSGSDGAAIVIGSDGAPINTYHYRNVIYDAVKAIRVEAAFGEIIIEGNIQYDIGGQCLALDKDGIDIQYIGNECRDAGRGIFQNWRDTFSLNVSDNMFENISGPAIEYESGAVGDASSLTDNVFRNTGAVIYNNTIASTEFAINDLPNSFGNIVE